MIDRSKLTRIGTLVKPHGIKGEISALFDAGIFPEDGIDTFFVELDGLMVPFRIEAVRERGAESRLLTVKGILSQEDAAPRSHHNCNHRSDNDFHNTCTDRGRNNDADDNNNGTDSRCAVQIGRAHV